MSDTEKISRARFVSGEMFDLTASSFNNAFGAEHNKGTIKYGINFPLEKFITELTMILANTDDDKNEKRQTRLKFLLHCASNEYVCKFFTLFCNYLNGGGTDSTDAKWMMQQYYNNYLIITAAGGNIVILFAQLIVNMLDAFIYSANKEDPDKFSWDIDGPGYELDEIKDDAPSLVQNMFSTSFRHWRKGPDGYWEVLNNAFVLLTETNRIVLAGLEATEKAGSGLSKEQLYFIIVKFFIQANNDDDDVLKSITNVAFSDISDFDFKLSPNIYPSKAGDHTTNAIDQMASMLEGVTLDDDSSDDDSSDDDSDDGGGDLDSRISNFIGKLFKSIKDDDSAGFLLFRVKTLIDCSTDYRQRYNTRQLKAMQRDCAQTLGNFVWGLYPQIMQASYLDDVREGSDCWNYLTYLMDKKNAIRDATRNSIDETMKFHQAGYYKQSNPLGDTFAMVRAAENSTEAIIDYIANITYNLNIYIENWETIKDGEHKLSSSAAPALHEGGLPRRFSHKSVCYNFLSLDSILLVDNGLISRLAADIINYFLNYPKFNTEQILDNLISSFNAKREELTGRRSNCYMPPSDLIAVPTNSDFNGQLRMLKRVLDGTRYSELGFPDGIRITLNAIETEDDIGDSQLDHVELEAQKSTNGDTSIQTGYSFLNEKRRRGRGNKVKTQRRKQRKQRKQKSLKIKVQKPQKKVTLKRRLRRK